MSIACEIDFDNNPQKVLYAGQLLSGSVRLMLIEQKTIRSIYIRIYGKAFCQWALGGGDTHRLYTGSEDYLNEKTCLAGDSDGEIQIGPGTYNYAFQCMLPAGLPTSVEGEIGYIRYTVRVILDIPKWTNKEFEVPFTVIRPINLNAIPALRQPVIVDTEKTFNLFCLLCCFSSDPLKIVASTPVGGYTPGQIINLEINVNNQSDQPISDFTVQLIKHITYTARANSSRFTQVDSLHKRVENIVIIEQDTRGCDVNQSEKIRLNIEVPPIPPTDFSTSKIVKVVYMINMIGSVACCHRSPELQLPITIGSYPLHDSLHPCQNAAITKDESLYPSSNVISDHQTVSSDQSEYSALPYPSVPFSHEDPPTFAEVIHLNDPTGSKFKPKYQIFKRTTSYSSGD